MKQSTIVPLGEPILNQKVLYLGKGNITFGKNVHIGYFPSPYFYSSYAHLEARNTTSNILIGDNTYINNNCAIISNCCTVQIGENCRIGLNFQCYDSDFHGLNPDTRDNLECVKNANVKIGNNVFIGNNVIVLKGVEIADGAIIGAGSVVTGYVPANTIYAGIPARFVKNSFMRGNND